MKFILIDTYCNYSNNEYTQMNLSKISKKLRKDQRKFNREIKNLENDVDCVCYFDSQPVDEKKVKGMKEEVFRQDNKIVMRMFTKVKKYTKEEKLKSFEDVIKNLDSNCIMLNLCFKTEHHRFNIVKKDNLEYIGIERDVVASLFSKYINEVSFNNYVYLSIITIHQLPNTIECAKAYMYEILGTFELVKQSSEFSKICHDNIKNTLGIDVEFV